jgi:hypothetical protein
MTTAEHPAIAAEIEVARHTRAEANGRRGAYPSLTENNRGLTKREAIALAVLPAMLGIVDRTLLLTRFNNDVVDAIEGIEGATQAADTEAAALREVLAQEAFLIADAFLLEATR